MCKFVRYQGLGLCHLFPLVGKKPQWFSGGNLQYSSCPRHVEWRSWSFALGWGHARNHWWWFYQTCQNRNSVPLLNKCCARIKQTWPAWHGSEIATLLIIEESEILLRDTWMVATATAVPQSFLALHISVHTVLTTRVGCRVIAMLWQTFDPLQRTRKARLLFSHLQ